MTDRVPGAPGRYSAVVAGEELQKLQNAQPFAITLTRDDQPIKEGTPYNKTTVLPDALAAQLCPGMEDPSPKDAFAALAAENTERKTEIAVERARINQFTALAEGSTTGDAELGDARVGVSGMIYPSAGEAVRGQVAEIVRLSQTANLFNINDPDAFCGRIGGSGNLIDTDTYFTTGFVCIQQGESLYLTRHSTGEKKAVSILTVEVYSEKKEEIERVQLGLSTHIYNCTNEAAQYVRIVFRSEYLPNDIMIAKSNDAEYVEFGNVIEFSEKAKQEVQKQIDETIKRSYILGSELEWELGTINNLGQNADASSNATKRIRTPGYIFFPKGSVICSNDPDFAVHLYDKDKNLVAGSITDWIQEYSMPDDYYVRFLIRKDSSSSEISSGEIDAVADKLSFKIAWDTILLPEIVVSDPDSVSDYVDIPEYFREMLPVKISQIVDNMANAGKHGETFIFITDLHWGQNFQNSPALVKKVIEKTGIKLLLCGGDLFQDGDKQEMIDLTTDLLNSFRIPDVLMPIAFGNHDSNTLNSTGGENIARTWSFDTVFGIIQKRFSSDVHYFSEDKCNFYFDRTDSKTRFIVLDTGTDGTYDRYDEFADVLISTPSGYRIILVQHWIVASVASNPYLTTHSRIMMNIIKSYNERIVVGVNGKGYDFTNAQGTIEFFLGGHTHFDYDFGIDHTENQSGVWVAMTDSDSYIGHESENTENTAQSQCFDVITVDYNNKTVKCVRIGRGENRYYSYNPENYGMLSQ